MDALWITNGFWLSLALYTVSCLLYYLRIVFSNPKLAGLGFRLSLFAFMFHAIFLVSHLAGQEYPYIQSTFDIYQVVSIALVFTFILISFFYDFYILGAACLPLVIVFYILGLTQMIPYQWGDHFLQNPWAFTHLFFILMAVSFFCLSFLVGALYLIQEYRIKNKKMGPVFGKFPALETMDLVHYRSVYTGFVFFTLGIITGGGWSKSTIGYYITNDFKQLVSIAAWIFLALFLNLKLPKGWAGRKGIVLSSMGLIAIIFLFLWIQK